MLGLYRLVWECILLPDCRAGNWWRTARACDSVWGDCWALVCDGREIVCFWGAKSTGLSLWSYLIFIINADIHDQLLHYINSNCYPFFPCSHQTDPKSIPKSLPFSFSLSSPMKPPLLACKINLKAVSGAVIIRITDISKIRFIIYALSINSWSLILPKELSWWLLLDEFLYCYAKDLQKERWSICLQKIHL